MRMRHLTTLRRVGGTSDRSIDVLVAKLRRKLGDDPRHPQMIKTVRGVGYKFTAPVEFN